MDLLLNVIFGTIFGDCQTNTSTEHFCILLHRYWNTAGTCWSKCENWWGNCFHLFVCKFRDGVHMLYKPCQVLVVKFKRAVTRCCQPVCCFLEYGCSQCMLSSSTSPMFSALRCCQHTFCWPLELSSFCSEPSDVSVPFACTNVSLDWSIITVSV